MPRLAAAVDLSAVLVARESVWAGQTEADLTPLSAQAVQWKNRFPLCFAIKWKF